MWCIDRCAQRVHNCMGDTVLRCAVCRHAMHVWGTGRPSLHGVVHVTAPPSSLGTKTYLFAKRERARLSGLPSLALIGARKNL